MKITGIHIENFGVWRDLDLSLSRSGINIFYGPNEAGKTTLMRFLRGALYGFQPFDWGRSAAHRTWSGSLHFECGGVTRQLHRSMDAAGRGRLSVSDHDDGETASEIVEEMLQGTDRRVFEHVFAIGLQELQELATLHHDEVADHIYGLTLGPEGKQLLEASADVQRRSVRLLDGECANGLLADLLRRDLELSQAVDSEAAKQEMYFEHRRKLADLDVQIADLKSRQNGMQSQLRGHMFLERAWTPWMQVREYEQQLDDIPAVAGFPEDGLARLEEIENELKSAVRCRDALQAEVREFHRQAEKLKLDPAVQEHATSIRSLLDQRELITRLGEVVQKAQSETREAQAGLDEKLARLGSEWSAERLLNVDSTPAAQFALMSSARAYQTARTRRARLRSRYRRIAKKFGQQSAELQENLKGLGGSSLEDAVAAEKQRLSDLRELGRLGLQEAELADRIKSLQSTIQAEDERRSIPTWVNLVWGLFGGCGILLVVLGVMTGTSTSLFGGLGYAFLGATCAIMGWGLKSHHSPSLRDDTERYEEELARLEVKLRQTSQSINRLAGDESFGPAPKASALPASQSYAGPDAGELIGQSARRLAMLEAWADRQERLQPTRRRLSELRQRFPAAQHDVSESRQSWCDALTRVGLAETVQIDDAFSAWQDVVDAATAQRRCSDARTRLEDHQVLYDAIRRRITALAEQTGDAGAGNDPLKLLANWETRLAEFRHSRQQRHRLKREAHRRKREIQQYQKQVDSLNANRSALFVQGGASSREEFEHRAGWVSTRGELEGYLSIAQAELEAAARTEPDMAVVEEDLLSFDAGQNSECIRTLKLELEELEQDLQAAHEQLGGLKQSTRALEDNREATELRFERAQNEWQLKQACECWFAVQLGKTGVDQIRARFERECQPSVLASASRFLQRMTRGRYTNVWTPLGERRLQIEDRDRATFSPEQLSGGTREQLFLAIRLAFIREFSRRGVDLPVVLDDILVNFDLPRTEATVETLLEFAAEDQQMLFFTCHQHLAEIFESKGSAVIRLPEHTQPVEERRAG